MVIEKTNLQEISSISLIMSNCEHYEINVGEIHNINLYIFQDMYEKDINKVIDGYIELSSSARISVSSIYKESISIGERVLEENFCLSKRLSAHCDVRFIEIYYKNCDSLLLHLPYDPLCDGIYGNEIEWSNCSSVEWQENKKFKIQFGRSSLSPKRIDNNYTELILGWNNIFNVMPNIIKCRLIYFSSSNHLCPRLKVTFVVMNGTIFQLIFEDYDHFECSFCSSLGDKYFDLLMSRMIDGKIFVKFQGIAVQFQCSSIKEYKYATGFDDDGDDIKIDVYRAAAKLEADEKMMVQIAYNHPAFEGNWLNLECIKKAFKLFSDSKISLNYLKNWLKFYSEVLAFCLPPYTREGKISSEIAFILDRLFINISYDYSIEKTKEIIRKYMNAIEIHLNCKDKLIQNKLSSVS